VRSLVVFADVGLHLDDAADASLWLPVGGWILDEPRAEQRDGGLERGAGQE
jgi:hypothetical protein